MDQQLAPDRALCPATTPREPLIHERDRLAAGGVGVGEITSVEKGYAQHLEVSRRGHLKQDEAGPAAPARRDRFVAADDAALDAGAGHRHVHHAAERLHFRETLQPLHQRAEEGRRRYRVRVGGTRRRDGEGQDVPRVESRIAGDHAREHRAEEHRGDEQQRGERGLDRDQRGPGPPARGAGKPFAESGGRTDVPHHAERR